MRDIAYHIYQNEFLANLQTVTTPPYLGGTEPERAVKPSSSCFTPAQPYAELSRAESSQELHSCLDGLHSTQDGHSKVAARNHQQQTETAANRQRQQPQMEDPMPGRMTPSRWNTHLRAACRHRGLSPVLVSLEPSYSLPWPASRSREGLPS